MRQWWQLPVPAQLAGWPQAARHWALEVQQIWVQAMTGCGAGVHAGIATAAAELVPAVTVGGAGQAADTVGSAAGSEDEAAARPGESATARSRAKVQRIRRGLRIRVSFRDASGKSRIAEPIIDNSR
jgi:hypothetical protein